MSATSRRRVLKESAIACATHVIALIYGMDVVTGMNTYTSSPETDTILGVEKTWWLIGLSKGSV